MKKISALKVKTVLILFLCVILFSACNRGGRPAPDALDRDTSYAFGMFMASMMAGMASEMGLSDIRFDYNAFTDGFKAFNEAEETRLSWDNAMGRIQAAVEQLQIQSNERQWLEGQKNLEEGEAFLAENARRSGVTTTDSGLQFEVITEGSGAKPGPDDIVLVHYEGSLPNGTVFDSSYQRGEPVLIPVGMVIPGWVEGLQLMSVGSTYHFVIPPALAYGSSGSRAIPANATLIFRVELLEILE
jgi:FKBP-type peptidyl-prolyl cis-trans isomerase FkpA